VSSPPLRILYVLNSADIYGASRCLARICAALDRTRFTPVVALSEDGPLVALLKKAGVEEIVHAKMSVITRRVFKSWRLIPFLLSIPIGALQLSFIIRKHRIDLVHTNVGVIPSAPLGAWLARVPHVWHIRDWYGEFRGLWKWYRRFILTFSDAVVCVSHAVAGQFPKDPKVIVVHDGFPLEEFAVDQAHLRAEFRKKFEIDPNRFVAGCIGRIKFVRKGQEFLVRAAAMLRQQNVDMTVVIVGAPSPGSEDHLPRLRSLVKQVEMSDRVVFTGEIADARPAYAALDVFVLTSAQPEPFGGVVMEAMCMSKPVIATALGGSLDQVVEGETGFLIPPADPDALAEKILILLKDQTLRMRMGAAARKRIETHFTLSQMIKKIETIYLELPGR
jgi:glycosyltransferase involved in cell wall biosynthesis